MQSESKTKEELVKELNNLKQEIKVLREAYDSEITEHLKTEESLRLSNELTNSLLKNVPLGMDIVDENGTILFINESLTQQFDGNCLGKKCWELYCDDKKQCIGCPLFTGITIGESKTHQSTGVLGGKTFQILHTGMIFKGKKAILETFIDITYRIQAESALKISESRFRTMFDDAPLGIAMIDSLTGHIYEVNSMFAKIAGRTLAEMANIDWIRITHPDDIQSDLDNMALLVEGKINGFQMEKRYIRPDGSFVWINMTISRLIDEKELPLRHLAMIEDITERKHTEELLRLNEQKFRTILDNLGEGVGLMNPEEQFEFANLAAEKIFNVQPGALIGMNLNQFITAEQFKLIKMETTKRSQAENSLYELDLCLLNGEKRSIIVTAVPQIDPEKGFTGTYGVFRDITSNKRAEEDHRRIEARFHSTFDLPLVGFAITSLDKGWLEINDAFLKMLGYPKQELVKLSWADITHPDDLTADEAQFTRVLAGEIDTYELEKRYIRKNGEVIYTQMSAGCVRNPDHSVDYFVALLQNITNRKLIENALRESEEKYRNLYESMKDSVITTDLEGNILDCNQVCLDMLGYTMEEMKNLTYQQFTPAKWHAFEDQILKTQITSRGYSDEYEKEYIRKDGSEIPISVRSWLIKDQDGHPSRLWSIIRDITTRKSAEQELQSKSSLLEAQLNATTEGILVIDKQNIRLLINQRFIDLLNIPAHLLAEKEDSMLLNYVVGLTENPQLFLEKVMYLNSHPDEKSYDEVVFKSGIIVERYSAPILSKDGKNDGRIWTFRDITSRKLTEQQIKLKNEELHKLNAERDKFYSIIAHDLRGPIGAIMGLSEMMADESQYFSEQERKDLTMEISHSSSNVFNLLEQLLEWSKSEQGLTDFNPQTLVLNDLVTKSAKIVGEQARLKSVDLIVKIPTDLEVFADQNMLQTILRNLISNAIKYTRQGGKVVVTGQAGEDMSTLISVKDSGIGMGKKILENLFRMDVDTKRPGTNGEHSTGLGILLCKEFIEKHGGTFSVESEEGKGSVFSFTIPYHEPIIGVTSVPVSIPEVIKNNTLNSLKILIAEDDEISAKLLRAMIKGFCKEILIVTNGTDAVKTIRNNPDINLILLDISMPELDGYEVTKQIRQFNTKVVIIAQTALALKSDIERALTAGCDDHISKPIKSNVLKLLILKYFEN